MLTRRDVTFGLTSLAFGGLALSGCAWTPRPAANEAANGYGPLVADPAGLLDLPRGFSYRIVSRFGDIMDDGFAVPDRADGMGCFALPGEKIALVRNHELQPRHTDTGPFRGPGKAAKTFYDQTSDGRVLPGGTTTLVLDRRGGLEAQYLSLAGTIRNCAGGFTPWGSWLSCEEDVTRTGDGVLADHGWVFEVPAAHRGLVAPVPLKALGRFNHEAAAVDPATGIVYLTEDRDDSLFYRLLPESRGELAKGGRLQALVLRALDDSRNWNGAVLETGKRYQAHWIDLDGAESPDDDLRKRGHAAGATLFARGEGIYFGRGEFFFCCTSGGVAKLGQIMRYRPSRFEGRPGERDEPGLLDLFVESGDGTLFNFGDNLCVAPNGHLVVCEDQYTDTVNNHLRGVTPSGQVYTLAQLRAQTELAGACFSPDGALLFVNVYSPGKTLAITGPWAAVRAHRA